MLTSRVHDKQRLMKETFIYLFISSPYSRLFSLLFPRLIDSVNHHHVKNTQQN